MHENAIIIDGIDSNFSINRMCGWFLNVESDIMIAASARKTSVLQPLFLWWESIGIDIIRKTIFEMRTAGHQ